MGGELISLLRLLRLKDALRSTINSKEFLDQKNFKLECCVLNNDKFWMYLFLMCRVLYAPMRVLRLADQQTASMSNTIFTFFKQIGSCSSCCQIAKRNQQNYLGMLPLVNS